MLSQNGLSMRNIIKQRFLVDVIRKSTTSEPGQGKNFSVLVLDKRATRVLSSVLRVYDVTQEGLATVESLEKKRPKLQSLEAIYIIEPTEESIKLVNDDFGGRESAHYAGVHLYFLRRCPPILIEAVKANPILTSLLKCCVEVNLDLLTIDANVFHLDMHDTLVDIFSPKTGNSFEQGSLIDYKKEKATNEIIERLVTVCAVLNEYPYIQYKYILFSKYIFYNYLLRSSDKLCEKVAKIFQTLLNDFIQQNENFWWNGDGKENHGTDENRGTVIILNRTEDLVSPFIHNFGYQNVVHDLLNTTDDVVRFTHDKEYHRIFINDQDRIFQDLKFDHMSVVLNRLNDFTAQLNKYNPQNQLNSKPGEAGQNGSSTTSSGVEIQNMINIIQNLNEYSELKERHLNNLLISQKIMELLETNKLIDVAHIEETMANYNVDRNAKRIKKNEVVKTLKSLLSNQKTDKIHKLRLLALFLLTQEDINEDTRRDVFAAVDPSLSPDEVNTVLNLTSLGVDLSAKPKAKKSKFFKTVDANMEAIEEAKNTARHLPPGSVSRYASRITKIVEKELGETDSDLCYVFQPPPAILVKRQNRKNIFASERNLSIRSYLSPFKGKLHDSVQDSPGSNELINYANLSGPRLILFVIGGITYSEIEQISRIMKKHNREIIIGSTNILTGDDFIFTLRHLDIQNSVEYERNSALHKDEQASFVRNFDGKLKGSQLTKETGLSKEVEPGKDTLGNTTAVKGYKRMLRSCSCIPFSK